MTRYSDLMCEDIFGCTHELEIPLSQDGEVVAWRCRCGEHEETVEQMRQNVDPALLQEDKK